MIPSPRPSRTSPSRAIPRTSPTRIRGTCRRPERESHGGGAGGRLVLDLSATYLATGRDFADGLVAGAAAGSQRGLLLLGDGPSLVHAPAARTWLADHARGFGTVRLAGGPVAISGAVEEEVRALLR